MALTGCAFHLLFVALFLIIVDAQDSPKYESFEGSIKSDEKDLVEHTYDNRLIMKRCSKTPLSNGSKMSVLELIKLSEELESLSSSSTGYSTTAPVTEQTVKFPTDYACSLGAPSRSTAGYSATDPVTQKLAVTSTMNYTSSSEDPVSRTSDYSTTNTVTDTETSTKKSASPFTESSDDGAYNSQSFEDPNRVGSMKGIPGELFPEYKDIPKTNFSCSDKPTVPGFYADLDADCQVFHVCWPDRRETFLCPVGTTFNQAILACDFWYSNNCSLAPQYYSVNTGDTGLDSSETNQHGSAGSAMDVLESSTVESSKPVGASKVEPEIAASALSFVSKFLPVKAEVVHYPDLEGLYSQTTESTSVRDDGEGSNHEDVDPEELTLGDAMVRPLWSLEYRMDQALMQAYKDLDDYFAPLLQADPPDRDMVKYKAAYTNIILQMRHFLRLYSPVDPFVPGTEIWPEKDLLLKSKAQSFRAWFVTIVKSAISKLLFEKWSRHPVEYPPAEKVPPAEKPKKILIAKPLSRKNIETIWQLYKMGLKNMEIMEKPEQWKSASIVSRETKRAILNNYFKFFKLTVKTLFLLK